MIGMGFEWEDRWVLQFDGQVVYRSYLAFQEEGKDATQAYGELSASYKDSIVPWNQLPLYVQEEFGRMWAEYQAELAKPKRVRKPKAKRKVGTSAS